jgi:hypothetical protein
MKLGEEQFYHEMLSDTFSLLDYARELALNNVIGISWIKSLY